MNGIGKDFFYKNKGRKALEKGIAFFVLCAVLISCGGAMPGGGAEGSALPAGEKNAPELSGVKDIYLASGHDCDYLEGITASDEKDGALTRQIVADASAVNNDEEGVYPVYYTVENSGGISAQEEADVIVADAELIQQWIDARQINRRRERIVGALRKYDTGISDEMSLEENLQYMKPASVRLRHGLEGGGYVAGAGFVMDISEDKVYICTNRHVVGDYADWEVCFYDGSWVPGAAAGVSENYDVGVVAVDRKDMPENLPEELMTVHIDLEYWKGLKEEKVEIGLLRMAQEDEEEQILTGTLIRKKTEFLWGSGEEETEIKIGQEAGDSGTAVFDQYGNLISMVHGTSHDMGGDREWGIPLDGIVEGYAEIMGGKENL